MTYESPAWDNQNTSQRKKGHRRLSLTFIDIQILEKETDRVNCNEKQT